MPRPRPLVSLHGAVNFDRLVPFDSAPNAPPLANNDILVMRKAAGGDNLTLRISDINATGSVNIAQLLGGVNTDMLYRVGGVWTGTGPTGLSYDGAMLTLDGDDLTLENGGNIEVQNAGNIEITGTGNMEISGGGSIMVSNDGNIEIEGANAQVILSNGAEMAFEGGAGIVLENGAAILFDGAGGIDFDGGAGDIVMGSGQLLAAPGTASIPSISFESDPNTGLGLSSPDQMALIAAGNMVCRIKHVTNSQLQLRPQSSFQNSPGEPLLQFHNSALGFYVPSGNIISLAVLGTQQMSFAADGLSMAGGGGAGPIIRNVGASASVPVIIPNQADLDTGLTRDTINGLSMVAGGLGCIRARAIGGARAVGLYTTTPIVQQTGVAVTAAAIHAACVNLGIFTA